MQKSQEISLIRWASGDIALCKGVLPYMRLF